eukprot:3594297-Amphidinium_carterae.1
MLSKRGRAPDDHLPASKKLQRGLESLFASNTVSGSEASHLIDNAAGAGLTNFQVLRSSGRDTHPHKHAARNLRRKLL